MLRRDRDGRVPRVPDASRGVETVKSGTVAACGPGLDAALTHYRITTATRPLEDDEEDGAVERIKVLQSSQLDLMFANEAARAELAVTENNRSRIDAIRASL